MILKECVCGFRVPKNPRTIPRAQFADEAEPTDTHFTASDIAPGFAQRVPQGGSPVQREASDPTVRDHNYLGRSG